MEHSNIISLRHLTKKFPVGDGHFTALKDINLEFGKGEFAGLVGPSGSGKTTMLNIIGSLDGPSGGDAVVMGQSISALSHKEAARLRNQHIGFIFQEYNLLPVYTVYENVEFALMLLNMKETDRKKAVMEALEWVGLTDKMDSKPDQLSGGQSQRVAIARAIVKRPAIVLADEPSANLDAENSHNILETMVKLNRVEQTTFIFSTHDHSVMAQASRIVRLVDGQISDYGLSEATA